MTQAHVHFRFAGAKPLEGSTFAGHCWFSFLFGEANLLLPLPLMAVACQKRLVADSSIGILDLMKVLRVWMAHQPRQDLLVAVSCPGACQWSWKTAPNPTWMKQVHDLMKDFFEKVAPNGVLPSAKLKAAITKMCADSKINRSKLHDQDFADKCDNLIRIVMAQFRTVKKSLEEYQRLMRKATPEEKDAVDSALSVLKLSTEEGAAAVQAAEPPGEPSTSLALVPYKGLGGHASSSSSDNMDIFKRILTKQDSSPSKILMAKKTNFNAEEQEEASEPFAGMMEKPKNVFLQGGLCVPADESTASETASAPSPKMKKPKIVAKSGGSSANQKSAAVSKAGLGLTEDDLEIMDQAFSQEVPSSKAQKMKKPAASRKAKSKASAKKKAKKQGDLKTTFRHRATSSAWASAKRRALAMGHSPKSARQAGRAAAMEVSRKIDSGVLQEK